MIESFTLGEIPKCNFYRTGEKNLDSILLNQYNAALSMLENCINNYKDDIWYNSDNYLNPAWQIAYHTIYYANIYCSSSRKEIVHWENEIADYNMLKRTSKSKRKKADKKYSQKEMKDFLNFVKKNIPQYLTNMKPDNKCWPNWYNLQQNEFHINNIRHIQHHTAQLIERHDIIKEMPYEWLSVK